MTLAKVIELSQELIQRRAAPPTMAATVAALGNEFEQVDHDLREVMATGLRPQTFHPSSNSGTPAGSGGVQPPNVGSNHGAPAHPASAAAGNAGGARVPLQTVSCGKVVPVPATVSHRVTRENKQDKSRYKLCCVICNEGFRDHRAVFTHFPGCVERNGNVNGARWYDHPSIDLAKLPDGVLEQVWR